MTVPRADLLLRRAAEVCTTPALSAGTDPAGVLAGAAVACHEGTIVWVGPDRDADQAVRLAEGASVLDAQGCTVTAGFVDCHTHAVFAGERADEFARRCAGAARAWTTWWSARAPASRACSRGA